MTSTSRPLTADLADPLYYLHNFQTVLDWVGERHGDLLAPEEMAFLDAFRALPEPSRALLARMLMRKGEYFRRDRLGYREVGDTATAMAPLISAGWVDGDPLLTLETLFALCTRDELKSALHQRLAERGLALSARKTLWLAALREDDDQARTAKAWGWDGVPVYQLRIRPLCDRLRLMFFGNLHQDWSEFVLAEQGTFLYETVTLSRASRPFQSREEVDAYLDLAACREQFDGDGDLEALEQALLPRLEALPDNPWLRERGHKLLFKVARERERRGEEQAALALYQRCHYAEARARELRVLEKTGRYTEAYQLARSAEAEPRNEAEWQQVQRVLPRLQRKLGHPVRRAGAMPTHHEFELTLPYYPWVELAARNHMRTASEPVYYVENTLINSLFGLLCWEALFAPLPGAFFHPFQSGPADLYRDDFVSRRRDLFEQALARLNDGSYRAVILQRFEEKYGHSSPFLFWDALDSELLTQALDCIPAEHLRLCFERLLADPRANRSGLPDLIQLWPRQRRYRMVEVKGPGDRLQDNQRRWLDYFQRHDIPVAVCHVRWRETE
ncbi:VRR-NUC domain-containing protein [Alloalcanivorax xenomutans]|uniref:VRR-NUC domain-containing protein n=1 Tax=Alloalcanivorax xenomutans TaxID=1094342 RepID=UPI0024E1C4FB|nr:VRR-NUC domain-containing protein [Alloalcanivorax xenomutans]